MEDNSLLWKRMKMIFIISIFLAVFGFSTLANADLIDNGGGLIYDTDLNITWYDHTNSYAPWSRQKAWAEGLSMTVNGITYANWRLPSTVDGQFVIGYDGTTTAGYNITTSEMGHLFYTELGNKGLYALDGTTPQTNWGLVNKGPFTTNLLNRPYASGTENSGTDNAWLFRFDTGYQYTDYKYGAQGYFYFDALAVHEGNVGRKVNLTDAILALQVLAGIGPSSPIFVMTDVNGDNNTGLAEVTYFLQKVGELR